ncbi:MAG TPA: two-component regulator propeller domain-containing protein [Thermoanaerobaculia bacterium]|jgi:diguanylate cyclase (GGDEF)-like protein|nr:two-component regulator propeller domain-containing protein [Thermoanaerobaculia bacterium]
MRSGWNGVPARRAARLGAILLLVGAANVAASRIGLVSFRRIQIPDEVPAHLCTALAQGRDGFLWIGTQGGLVRYDGYSFRIYRPDPNDPRTLAGSYVRTLLAAADGRLWVGTFSSGLSVYDPATGRFTRYRHEAQGAGLSHDRVEGLAEDRSGRIWIATYEGLDRLEPGTGKIGHFRHDPRNPFSLADDRVRGLLVDHAGQVWVGSRDGLQRWRGEGRGFERVASDRGDSGSLAGKLVSKLYEDSRGRIWIGTTDDGGAVLDPHTGRLHWFRPGPPEGLSHYWVYGFAEAAKDEVWIATFGGGIDVVDAGSLKIIDRLQHDPTLESTVGGDRIGAVLKDRSGVVWVGTWGEGLARHDPAARAFRTLRYSPNRPDGLSHPAAVRALEMQDGTLWVGTNGNGVDVFDREQHRIGGYRPDPHDPGALADGSVTCLAQAADGTIWVATLNGVLHRLRPGRRSFERLSAAQGLPGGPIRAMAFGPDGELWAGSAEGLARIDPRTSSITAFHHRPGDPRSLSSNTVEAIAVGADGTLWIGTDSGLNAFDPRSGIAVRITHQPGRRDSLPNNWVPDLLIAADGRLWVGTQGGACILTSWNGREARCEPVAERLGRTAAPVEALIQDAQGRIWLGPRLRVEPKTWRWQELGPADGCEFRNFFIASRARTAAGTLLFGSPEGLLLVHPERIQAWTYEPPVVVTSLQVGSAERPAGRLILSPDERGFSLDFAAIDFTAPQRNLYRHRLEGFDPGWIATDAVHRSLTYTNLPPGSYTLRIQGSNRTGRWSPREIRLPVKVLPAFYQTAAFKALIGALGLALAYGIYRLRVRRLQARGRELERLVQERTTALEERGRELEAAYLRIEEASLTDPLTQLHNRRYLEQAIGGDLALCLRRHEDGGTAAGQADLVFLLLDLDHFKSVNDTYGHAAGDAVLIQTAGILRATFRASDHVVRWGGEEFLVVARFVDRGDAPELAEKVRAGIAAHDFRLADGSVLRRTCSIGFAAYPFAAAQPRAIGWEMVVDAADHGLYAAKRSGRNGWVGVAIGDAGDPETAIRRLKEDLAAAVESGEIRLRTEAP